MTHSMPTVNPCGGAVPRREVAKPALDTPLLERVVDPDNMRIAWKQVVANQGAPGVDRMTLEEADTWLRTNWDTLRASLLDGAFLSAVNECPNTKEPVSEVSVSNK